MADVVLNSIGIGSWNSSLEFISINGRLVTFGGLTGADVKLNVQSLYSKQIKIIGSNRRSRRDLYEIINTSKGLKSKVWKRFNLDDTQVAIQSLFAKEREGQILLDVDK